MLPLKCVFLPHELITEILSFLPVKSLMRLKCVSKSWKTLISNPIFVKLHLKQSARNNHLAIVPSSCQDKRKFSFTLLRLLDNASVTITDDDTYFQLKTDAYIYPIGSYNRLICLICYSQDLNHEEREILFYVWNPATRTLSKEIEFLHRRTFHWMFAFGYDNSTEIYKIVAFHVLSKEMRVFSFGDNAWKTIQSILVDPLDIVRSSYRYSGIDPTSHGVYVRDNLNWLAIRKKSQYEVQSELYDSKSFTIEQFVIISFDLSTETYRQLLLPRGFDKVPLIVPTLSELMESLCFSHDFNGTDLIIWQMKEFGVQDSWIQFLKISYQSLPIVSDVLRSQSILFPLYLSENGHTLILAWDRDNEPAILYNLRDNKAEKTEITNRSVRWVRSKNYVETLVSTCCKKAIEGAD